MRLAALVQISRPPAWRKSVIPLENGIQLKATGMDPGFHRGDDTTGMTEGRSTPDRQNQNSSACRA